MKKIISILLVCILGSISLFIPGSFAQTQKFKKEPLSGREVSEPKKIILKSNVYPIKVYSTNCPRERGHRNDSETFLVQDIWVSIANYKCPTGQIASPSGHIIVIYHDADKGVKESKSVTFTSLPQNATTNFKVVEGKIRVNKSFGIHAKIYLDPPFQSCAPSENIIHECETAS